MNPNDILAQQQAALNQMMQSAQHVTAEVMAIELVVSIVTCWVIYMFYARLRDIVDELRKFRIAYEFAEDRNARARSTSYTPGTTAVSVPQSSKPVDAKYMPKS